MIKARNIKKCFDNLEILKGINLEIKKGEIVAIVGPSGAGKTTLLQIMGTLDRADDNPDYEMIINGIETKSLSDKEISAFRNKQIGFGFQFHQLLPEFTAIENVCLPGFIAKRNKKEVEKDALELLELLGLKDRIHHKPSELSGGENQRVAVARALINKPAMILADEPSGNLDSKTAEDLHKLFFELRDKFQQTFVIITHNEKLANMADRKLQMKDGCLV